MWAEDTTAVVGVVIHAVDEYTYDAVYFDLNEWESGASAYHKSILTLTLTLNLTLTLPLTLFRHLCLP